MSGHLDTTERSFHAGQRTPQDTYEGRMGADCPGFCLALAVSKLLGSVRREARGHHVPSHFREQVLQLQGKTAHDQ
ncbi:hypothetical protein V5799_024434 [Amblyomma americanum]|uniref:Uncharacterized protein n=1 Tax=Amblyomma americanum TaxID=6943 RepID=A0AAQ4EC35_AMBAM